MTKEEMIETISDKAAEEIEGFVLYVSSKEKMQRMVQGAFSESELSWIAMSGLKEVLNK